MHRYPPADVTAEAGCVSCELADITGTATKASPWQSQQVPMLDSASRSSPSLLPLPPQSPQIEVRATSCRSGADGAGSLVRGTRPSAQPLSLAACSVEPQDALSEVLANHRYGVPPAHLHFSEHVPNDHHQHTAQGHATISRMLRPGTRLNPHQAALLPGGTKQYNRRLHPQAPPPPTQYGGGRWGGQWT